MFLNLWLSLDTCISLLCSVLKFYDLSWPSLTNATVSRNLNAVLVLDITYVTNWIAQILWHMLLSSHTMCSPMAAAVAQRPQLLYDRDSFCNHVTLNFKTSWPSGQCPPSECCRVCVPSLVLIAQAIFVLELGHTQTDPHTHTVTNTTDHHIPCIGQA